MSYFYSHLFPSLQSKPNLFLTLEDMVPYHPVDVPISPDIIPPLYVMDLQQLLLYGIQGNMCSFKPRCSIIDQLLIVCLLNKYHGSTKFLQHSYILYVIKSYFQSINQKYCKQYRCGLMQHAYLYIFYCACMFILQGFICATGLVYLK